jgi:hypothetical protein
MGFACTVETSNGGPSGSGKSPLEEGAPEGEIAVSKSVSSEDMELPLGRDAAALVTSTTRARKDCMNICRCLLSRSTMAASPLQHPVQHTQADNAIKHHTRGLRQWLTNSAGGGSAEEMQGRRGMVGRHRAALKSEDIGR